MKKYMLSYLIFSCIYVCLNLSAVFKLGVENVSREHLAKVVPHKKGRLVAGVITNQTGVDQKNKRTVDLLLQNNCCDIAYIFVPEHGLSGISAERDVPDGTDHKTKIPVVSLYGNGTGKMIPPDLVKNIDLLIFDIQDSGMRHYTYISTLLNTMKIAAEYDKPFVVLDRPNPLGNSMQGPLVEPELISFISIASIPLRHGMTIGELARYFNVYELQKPVQLYVIALSDYNPKYGLTAELVQQLSPNIRSLQSCYGYSFLGLLGEIEPFDVGIGTDMAFRCVMLPESMKIASSVWQQLKNMFHEHGIKSYAYTHTNPRSKKKTSGLRLEFSSVHDLQSFTLFLALMDIIQKNNIAFSFSKSFNKAVGTCKVKDVILNERPSEMFFDEIEKYVKQFREKAKSVLLYKA